MVEWFVVLYIIFLDSILIEFMILFIDNCLILLLKMYILL